MIQLQTADSNYNPILPIVLGSGGINTLSLKTELNKAKELSVVCNSNLSNTYSYIKDDPESRLLLKITGAENSFGFWKSTNVVTDLLVFGDIGKGSDSDSAYVLDSSFYASNSSYPIDLSNPVTFGNQTGYFIKNNKASNLTKRYYEIKVFSQQFNSLLTDGIDTIVKAKQRLYQDAVNYLDEQNQNYFINQQKVEQNGLLSATFYSSIYELKRSYRTVPFNFAFNQTSAKSILDRIDSNLMINYISTDKNITINTGILDNFDLFTEVIQKSNWSYRDDGLINIGTNLSPIYKTAVTVGNFEDLEVSNAAFNQINDNWFHQSGIRIKSVEGNYPTYNIDLEVNEFINEGSKIQVNYKSFNKDIQGKTNKVIDINQALFWKGFTGGIDLYKFR